MKRPQLSLLALGAAISAGPVLAFDVSTGTELINRPNTCSQLESSVGLRGEQCGQLSLGELATIHGLQNGN